MAGTIDREAVLSDLRKFIQEQINQVHGISESYLAVSDVSVHVTLHHVWGHPPAVGDIEVTLDIDKRIA